MKNLDKIFMGLFIVGTALLVISVCFFRLAPIEFNIAMSVLQGVVALIMIVLTAISAIKNHNSSNSAWYSNPFQTILFSVILIAWSIAVFFVM